MEPSHCNKTPRIGLTRCGDVCGDVLWEIESEYLRIHAIEYATARYLISLTRSVGRHVGHVGRYLGNVKVGGYPQQSCSRAR